MAGATGANADKEKSAWMRDDTGKRSRQGDIWATAKTLVVAPSMPGINICVCIIRGFFYQKLGGVSRELMS